MPFQPRTWNLLTLGLFLLVAAPIVASLVDGARDLYCDAAMIRTVALRTEMGHLRSRLVRRAGRLEHFLESRWSMNDAPNLRRKLEKEDRNEVMAVWRSIGDPENSEAYWAVVNLDGKIVLHTDVKQEGQLLKTDWDDVKEPDAGKEVMKISPGPFAGEGGSYDVHVPIFVHDLPVGLFHSGINARAFDQRVALEQRHFLWKKTWVIALLLLVNLAAVAGIVLLARRFAELRSQLARVSKEESRRLAQIGMGLAHEVRNPLHALRINIHTLRRSMAGKALSEKDTAEMMRESCDEIDRMEVLMRDFVQYTAPQPVEESVDVELFREVQATVNLLAEELRQRQITVESKDHPSPLVVNIPPSRLRKVALELLTFAQNCATPMSTIEIALRADNGFAELTISDTGRELSPTDQARLFEPFQSTPCSQAGLGLALIHQFVQDAKGTLVRRRSPGMNSFVLRLPLAHQITT